MCTALYGWIVSVPEINEADIQRLVRNFYAAVRLDPLLAPVFATKIKEDEWDHHMAHIADFWSSIFLKTGRFHGNPMSKHAALPDITPAHFTRWLAVFADISERHLKPDQAEAMQAMAERIGKSLQMGLAFNREQKGEMDHPFTAFSVKPVR